jgi:hypothetical protein
VNCFEPVRCDVGRRRRITSCQLLLVNQVSWIVLPPVPLSQESLSGLRLCASPLRRGYASPHRSSCAFPRLTPGMTPRPHAPYSCLRFAPPLWSVCSTRASNVNTQFWSKSDPKRAEYARRPLG